MMWHSGVVIFVHTPLDSSPLQQKSLSLCEVIQRMIQKSTCRLHGSRTTKIAAAFPRSNLGLVILSVPST